MTLTQQDRVTDKEIAEVVNELEDCYVKNLTEENDSKIRALVDKLNSFSDRDNVPYIKRAIAHASEIRDLWAGIVDKYKKSKRTLPRLSIVYLRY